MSTIRPKKTLGQHFLRSKQTVERIVRTADIAPGDHVVEVGPGEGVLTNELLTAGARVIAIEKDPRCVALLNERFADALADGHLQLIDGDILLAGPTKVLFDDMLAEATSYKVVANIPYYITGLLFRYFLQDHRQPSSLTFLVQHEVGEQIAARDGKESILSLSVKIFGDPHYRGKVHRTCFSPPPKVDSAIISVQGIGRERLRGLSDKHFFSVLKAGFRAKRKKLVNNIADGLDYPKDEIVSFFQELDIDPHTRGEDLPIEQWVALANLLSEKKKTR